MTASARHETRALLRAHLSAAAGYRHLTRHCPICQRLLRLAMEPAADRDHERDHDGDLAARSAVRAEAGGDGETDEPPADQ